MKKWFMLFSLLLLFVLTACGAEITAPPAVNTPIFDQSKQVDTSSSPNSGAQNNVASPSPSTTPVATSPTNPDGYEYVLEFPSDSYPETALHIYSAIENGHSDVCTIDREGADDNRKKSLAGIDTMKGYDRDEWPMAMCAEGGEGASVAYINPSDNRGAGSWVGHQLSAYDNGEKVLFIVEKPKNLFGKNATETESVTTPTPPADIIYKNCTEVREAGAAPLLKGDPGYSKKLDRDGDGIACEI